MDEFESQKKVWWEVYRRNIHVGNRTWHSFESKHGFLLFSIAPAHLYRFYWWTYISRGFLLSWFSSNSPVWTGCHNNRPIFVGRQGTVLQCWYIQAVSESKQVTVLPNTWKRITRKWSLVSFSVATQIFLLGCGNCSSILELVRTPTVFPTLIILSLLTCPSSASPSQSSTLLHSQLISCWMNTATFVSQTSALPVIFPRRNLTPACKCFIFLPFHRQIYSCVTL